MEHAETRCLHLRTFLIEPKRWGKIPPNEGFFQSRLEQNFTSNLTPLDTLYIPESLSQNLKYIPAHPTNLNFHIPQFPTLFINTTAKMATTRATTLNVSINDLAKMIDHSLLHPTMTDDFVANGLEISKKYGVATACVKPYHILFAKKILDGSGVGVCPVIGFPHGNSTTEVKVFEARRAAEEGGTEVDSEYSWLKALMIKAKANMGFFVVVVNSESNHYSGVMNG